MFFILEVNVFYIYDLT